MKVTLSIVIIVIISALFYMWIRHRTYNRRYRALFQLAPYGVILINRKGRILDANPNAHELLNLHAQTQPNFFQLFVETEKEVQKGLYEQAFDSKTGFREFTNEVQTSTGSRNLLTTTLFVQFGRSDFMFVFLIDTAIREQKQAEAFQLAYEDTLTGLYNRDFFRGTVERFVTERHPTEPFSLMVMDIDRFKLVNDTIGQNAGDQLLREISFRLRVHADQHDIIARLSGDEFALLISSYDNEEQLFHKAQALLETINMPFEYEHEEIYCTASIGISLFPHDSTTSEHLLGYANIALHQAKQSGKNTFRFYSQERSDTLIMNVNKEKSLRRAIERHELTLYYQPQLHMKTGKIVGAEALLRWFSPEWGEVSPAEFIPLAEESGIILNIGEWVLEKACTQVNAWNRKGILSFPISINISGIQLYSDTFAATVKGILSQTGVKPSQLGFEITETAAIRNMDQVYPMMLEFAELGFHLSIDDFGLGYSSLAMLRQLPVHVVKIDKSFVSDLNDGEEHQALVEAIIAMSKSLKLSVIAEGVETQKQWDILNRMNCDIAQGYKISMPLSATDFESLLLKQGGKIENQR